MRVKVKCKVQTCKCCDCNKRNITHKISEYTQQENNVECPHAKQIGQEILVIQFGVYLKNQYHKTLQISDLSIQ